MEPPLRLLLKKQDDDHQVKLVYQHTLTRIGKYIPWVPKLESLAKSVCGLFACD